MKKDHHQLIQLAEDAGWKVRQANRGGHMKLYSPCGKHMVVTSFSPSDHRATKNLRSILRRCGLEC
jgi:predicted RNA binding protein YcfA (HicA-like mRNA interferase family)